MTSIVPVLLIWACKSESSGCWGISVYTDAPRVRDQGIGGPPLCHSVCSALKRYLVEFF